MQRRTAITIVSAILASLLLSSCATVSLLDQAKRGPFVEAKITHLETAALTKEGSLIVCFLGSKPNADDDSTYHLTLPLKSYRAAAALHPVARDDEFGDTRYGATIRLRAESMFKPECPLQPMPKGMEPLPVLGAPLSWPALDVTQVADMGAGQRRLPVPDNFTEVLYAHSTKLYGEVANLTYAAQEGFVTRFSGESKMNYLIFKFHGKKKPRSYLRAFVPLTVAVDVVTIPVQIVIWVIAVASGGH